MATEPAVPAPGGDILFLANAGDVAGSNSLRTWHRSESFPSPCSCGCYPLIVDYNVPWRPRSSGIPDFRYDAAPCVTGTGVTESPSSSSTVHPGGFMLGDRVEVIPEHRHRYEQDGPCDFHVEGFGTRNEDDAPVVRIQDRTTGVYTYSPPGWLRHRRDAMQEKAARLITLSVAEIAKLVCEWPDLVRHLSGVDAAAIICRLANVVAKDSLTDNERIVRIERSRTDRGYADAVADRPPTETNSSYQDGYLAGVRFMRSTPK